MKKTTLISAMTLVGLMTAGTATAFAADGGTLDTNGFIEYSAPDKPTPPTNPTDPSKPVEPTPTDPQHPNKPGTGGPLSIDFASNFNFGKQDITALDKTYDAAPQKFKVTGEETEQTGPNYVQVSDNRGNEKGWRLTVKQTEFMNGEHKLEGAQLQLDNQHVVSNSQSTKPDAAASVDLIPNQVTEMMNAAPGTGAGTFLLDWGTDAASGAKSVHLMVPGKTTKYTGQYSATLTWNLTDTPANK